MKKRRLTAEQVLDVEMKVRAYAKGFINGADNQWHGGSQGRTVVEPSTHEHWRRGFEHGKKALDLATTLYRDSIEEQLTGVTNETTTTTKKTK